MKNLFLGLVVLLLATTQLHAQAVHDAYALRALMKNGNQIQTGNNNQLYQILARNMTAELEGLTYNEIVDAYADNPFIAPYLSNDLESMEIYAGVTGQRSLAGLGSAATGLGLPGSTFLLGLTDFLVTRTKQELTIAFFRDFQKIVNQSEEMQYLFPNTTKILLKIDEDIYQFKAFWEVLRESFLKDLESMVYNLDDYIQMSSKIKDPTTRHMMSDFFKVIELFYDQTTPAEVVHYLANDAYIHAVPSDAIDAPKFVPVMQSSLKLLGLLSASLENEDKNGYWVDTRMISMMVQDTLTTDMYLGLIYQQGQNLEIADQTLGGLLTTLHSNQKKGRQFMNQIMGFLEKAKRIERLAKDMRRKDLERKRNRNALPQTDSEKEMEYDEYHDFTQNICEMTQYAYTFKKQLVGSTSEQDSAVQKYLSIISDLNNMSLSIRKQHYTSALINSLFVIEKLLPDGKFNCERKVLMKYGTFVATAVQAKTPSEVSDAIAAFALPPGGSAIKKYSKFSIALNAYVGVSAGQEVLRGYGSQTYYAVTTPIGVTFNWGFQNAGAIGVMASLLDIGALTAFRFQDNSANSLPDLKFENVLAPGGYLIYNFPKYPISLGVGAQMGPNIRSVTNNGITSTTSGWRWGAFLAVDLPMVSFFSTNTKYRQCCKKCKKKENIDF